MFLTRSLRWTRANTLTYYPIHQIEFEDLIHRPQRLLMVGFCIKSPTTEAECAKGVFKIHSLISSVVYVKITGHGQHEWSWTSHNIWNLLAINLKDKSYSTMLGENFWVYSVQITRKCICETPTPFAWCDH